MSKFILEGPARLKGEIKVSGAKNAALKIIPAALLSADPITIDNLPQIEDTGRALEIFTDLGGTVNRNGQSIELSLPVIGKTSLDPALANKLRSSVMFVGPLLARAGEVSFPHPGGCVIGAGSRPIDLFLDGFTALGAEVEITEGHYHLKARELKGADYFFTTVSVTGTEAMMMTAVLARGTTTLRNAAMEPEIVALAEYLNAQGADIKGAGTPVVSIRGVERLRAGRFAVMPDRIETGTFAILAAATRSELKITHCLPDHIGILLSIFKKIGVPFEAGPDRLVIRPAANYTAKSIKTHEYPGFPTDLQSPYTVMMTQAQGTSLIHETIYDRRLLYIDMLMQMGADIIMCDPHRVVVNGPTKLYGKRLTSPDLRAGIAMIIAALIANGQTEIDNIYQIDRGYEDIDSRLRAIGADIRRLGTLNLK